MELCESEDDSYDKDPVDQNETDVNFDIVQPQT
jgi:hypothetical protein